MVVQEEAKFSIGLILCHSASSGGLTVETRVGGAGGVG